MKNVQTIRRRVTRLEAQQRIIDTEITALKAQLRREEENRFVQVNFIGHNKLYVYEIPEPFVGHVEVGDYLSVWSPMTGNDEIVKVVLMGRGDWRYGTKLARPIRWSVDHEIPF